VPIFDGTLVPYPLDLALPLNSGADGSVTVGVDVPRGVPVGTAL
jgi:hypothetical protein